MPATTLEIFESALAGSSAGFNVSHIAAIGFEICHPEEIASVVFARHPEYDKIPIQGRDCILGVMEC